MILLKTRGGKLGEQILTFMGWPWALNLQVPNSRHYRHIHVCACFSYHIINPLLLKSTFHIRLVFVFISQRKSPDITTSV